MDQKERILKAAQDLFSRAGIKSITMNDIAAHLGISKKTIYQYFSDKNGIVHELAVIYLNTLQHTLQALDDRCAVEAIFNTLQHSSEIAIDSRTVICFDLQRYHPATWLMLENFQSNVLVPYFQKLLDKGIGEGHIRPDMDTGVLARLKICEFTLGYNQEIFPEKKFSSETVQEVLMEHFIQGICTPLGLEAFYQFKHLHKEEQ